MSDDEQLAAFFYDFRSFLAVDSAFDESHKRRLQSNRAQQKLLRLPPTFFLNLATDVHDELTRRLSKSTDVALEHNSTFHPRRNVSRQKLSRLSANRFNDLCFDILFEIERRNPILRNENNSASIPTSSKVIDPSHSISSDNVQYQGLSQNELPPLLAAGNLNKTSPNNNTNHTLHTNSENDITITPTVPAPSMATEAPTTSTTHVGPDSSENDLPPTTTVASTPLVIISKDKTSTAVSDATTTPIRTQFNSTDFNDSPPAPPSSVGSSSCYSDVTRTPSTALTSPATSEAGAAAAPLKPLSDNSGTNLSKSVAESPEVSSFKTSTLTPTKSTLVEDSENDDESGLSDISEDEADLGVDRHPSVNAALRAWSIKNSSQADITSLNHPFNVSGELNNSGDSESLSSSDSENGNEDRYGLAHDFNIGEDHDGIDLDDDHQDELNALTLVLSQNSAGNNMNSDNMKRSYPLHSIEEERSPYIPQRFLKRASTSPYSNHSSNSGTQSPQERRRSLSETMSSSIPGGARSRSFNKLDNMHSKSNSPDYFQDFSAESLLQRTIKEKDDHIKALIDEGTRLDETISQLTKQLSESETQRQALQQENHQLHVALSGAEVEKDKLEQELKVKDERLERAQLESEEKHAQTKRDAEQLLAQKLEIKDSEIEQALIEKDKEISQLRANKDSELAQLLADKDSEIAQLKASHKELELHHEKLKNKHNEVMSKQTEFAGSSANLSSQITLLESKLLKQDEVILGLRKELKESKSYKAPYEELQRDYNKLEEELKQQQKITDQVRTEASAFLNEMRALAESQSTWGGSERHAKELATMKNEIKEWKAKYAKCKAQLRNLKTSSISADTVTTTSSAIAIPSVTAGRAFTSSAGLITEANVTRFQLTMDGFVLQARKRNSDEKALLEKLHGVVVATRTITQEVGSASLDDENLYRSSSGVVKEYEELQGELAQATSLVSVTANQLITASRNHCAAKGLASVLLVDAASADLSSAVIELIKLAKVRTSGGRSEFVETPDSSSLSSRTLLQSGHAPHSYQTHRRGVGSAGSYNTITSIEGLQDFLESRTVFVIESIASLLTGIKGNANYGAIRHDVAAITDGAQAVIAATHHSPVSSSRDVSAVLAGLEGSCRRFQTIYGETVVYDEALLPDKAHKQRLAGLSSEMARWTTDLLKIVETVRSDGSS